MARQDSHFIRTCYSGSVNDKLTQARILYANLDGRAADVPGLTEALAQLREHARALDEQMRVMEMGQRCGQCAAAPGGGCCSAFMAGNADAVQLLINLLMGVDVIHQEQSGEDCGFLGPQGCLFPGQTDLLPQLQLQPHPGRLRPGTPCRTLSTSRRRAQPANRG